MSFVVLSALGLIGLVLVYAIPRLNSPDSRVYRAVAKAAGIFPRSPSVPDAVTLPVYERFDSGTPASGWEWINTETVDVYGQSGFLRVDAVSESVWWMNRRGPFFYKAVDGDVDVRTEVKVRKKSDSTSAPDKEWQFAGIMMRDPRGSLRFSLENYVFIVVGHRGSRLQVEFKSTVDGYSDVDAVDWPSGDAELRITRRGSVFDLFAKEKSEVEWVKVASYTRDDLPGVLETGVVVYAFSEGRQSHDLTATFEQLNLMSIESNRE